jgi:WD40 repeat protein
MQIKRNLKFIASAMILSIFVIGCEYSPQLFNGKITHQADHETGTETVTVRETDTPVGTQIVSKLEINSIIDELVPVYFLEEEVCPELESIVSGGKDYSGSLLVVDHDQKQLLFYELATGELTPVLEENEEAVTYAVSPNGLWLAMKTLDSDTHQPQLKIISLKDEETFSMPWQEGWIRIAYWLDNQHFFISTTPFDQYDLYLVNPFTNEKQLISYQSEDMFNLEWPPDWKGAGPVSYSPDLGYLVFASWRNENILANVKTGKILLSTPYISFHQFPNKSPQWSPDGNSVLIPIPLNSTDYMNDELLAININGSVTRLTNLSEVYELVSINRYSWSPDANNIAILYSASGTISGEQLAILDLEEGVLSPYCIQADQTDWPLRTNLHTYYDQVIYDGVVWSPDGSHLILENTKEGNKRTSYLIDLEKNIAYALFFDTNMQVVGWMVDE